MLREEARSSAAANLRDAYAILFHNHHTATYARRRRAPRGQSLTEFALAIPIFCALLLGSLEMGMLFKTHAAYQEAAQEAVRVATAVGNTTDQPALDEVKTILAGDNLNNITSVTVFDATLSETVSITPNTYTTYVYSSTAGLGGAFVCSATLTPPPCDPTKQSYWDPSARNTTMGSLDRVGIQINYRYRSVTGAFHALAMSQIASAQMEPTTYGS